MREATLGLRHEGAASVTMPSRTSDRGSESGRTWYGGDSPHLPLTLGGGTGKAGENGQPSQWVSRRSLWQRPSDGYRPTLESSSCRTAMPARGLEARSLSTGSPAGHAIGAGDYLHNDDAPLRGSMYSQATVSRTSGIPATHWSASGAGVIRGTEKETLGSTGGAPTGSLRAPSWCLSARACVLHSRLGGRQ